jgi:hypothetical protein
MTEKWVYIRVVVFRNEKYTGDIFLQKKTFQRFLLTMHTPYHPPIKFFLTIDGRLSGAVGGSWSEMYTSIFV